MNSEKLKECYEKMGGDYADVSTRLPKPELVEKFVSRFLEDESFAMLCQHMEEGNQKDTFRDAHTLKGVCANLGFVRLYNSSARLTEELRPEGSAVSEHVKEIFDEVKQDYKLTVDTIRSYLENQ